MKEFNSLQLTVPLKVGGKPQKKKYNLFDPGTRLPSPRVNSSRFYKTQAEW